MIKKKIKILVIIIFMISVFNCLKNNQTIDASSGVNAYFIFNQQSYQKGEKVKLTVNVDQKNLLNEVKLRINYVEGLQPLKINDEYFSLTSSSFLTDVLINDYLDKEYLRLHLLKETKQNQELGYKNNLCEITFLATMPINNIYELFKDLYSMYLFDSSDQLISYNVYYNEQIKVKWPIDCYKIEVYEEIPDYLSDCTILNREPKDYEIIINGEIDNTKLGIQTINIIIIDKTNYDYLFLSKAFEVKDTIPPTVNEIKEINLMDSEIGKFNLSNYLVLNDNYDLSPQIVATYYNNENEEIASLLDFKKYLEHNLIGKLKFKVIDTSNNQTQLQEVIIKVIDTTAPVIEINFNEIIEVKDTKLEDFQILDYFKISDNYDDFPKLIIEARLENSQSVVDDILDALKQGENVKLYYFALDNLGNQSLKQETLIKVLDTTAPVLSGVLDLTIKDYEVSSYRFDQSISYFDNIDQNPTLITRYYLTNEESVVEVKQSEFIMELLHGRNGYIEYSVVDSSLNYSERLKQSIKVIDTTPPQIKLINIEEEGKYLKLDAIQYQIEDNFDNDLDILITLNGYLYENTKVADVGEYTLVIEATDQSGNKNKQEIHFRIIENNILGCGNDLKCFINNYYEVVIIVSVLMAIIIVVFIVKIVYSVNSKKKGIKKKDYY